MKTQAKVWICEWTVERRLCLLTKSIDVSPISDESTSNWLYEPDFDSYAFIAKYGKGLRSRYETTI